MKFTIIIPTIRQITMLVECIASFQKHHGKDHEIIVVEDGSDSGTQLLVKNRCEAMGCKVLLSKENQGFSKSMNWGIREASGDVILSVNNDVLFTKPILHYIMQDFERDPKIGLVGALLYYSNGLIQHGGIFRNGFSFGHRGYQKRYENAPEVHAHRYLIAVTGAVYAMRREMFQDVGLFDEDYFISCDDTQYCIRAWEKGWRTLYDPRVEAIHKEGETRGRDFSSKMMKGRDWFIKENKVQKMFFDWLQQPGRDLNAVDRLVNEANLSSLNLHKMDEPDSSIPKPPAPETKADAKVVEEAGPVSVIGVRRTGAFGDALMATPIIRALKAKHPHSRIVVATHCPDAFHRNKNVSQVVREIEQLRQVTDVIYDLDLVYEKNPKQHIVDAYYEAVFGRAMADRSLDLVSDEDDFKSVMPLISSINFERDRVIVLHMGVSWANRTWPRPSWMTVVKSLATRGYKIVVVGRGGDYRSDLFTGVYNILERPTIPMIREIIKRAHCFVGIDSGLLHVAQTTETPIVGLFTIANPEFRIVRKDKTHCLVPFSPCKFCLHDQAPPVTFAACKFGTNHCLKEITPNDVISAVSEMVKLKP